MIELLVTVVIMLLLSGGGIAAFISFNERQVVINGAKELQTYLRTAQVRAQVGDRPSTCDTLNGYIVRSVVVGSTTEIRILTSCNNGEELQNTHELPAGTQLESPLEMRFLVLHGGVDGFATINVVSDFGKTYQFAVTQGGEITQGGIL